jgi:putative tricarboxylic transport membrane protein
MMMKKNDIQKHLFQYKDTCMGCVMLLVFAGMFFLSENIKILEVSFDVGPRFFPKLVGVLGAVLSVLVIINDLQFSKKRRQDADPVSGKKSENKHNVIETFLALAFVIGYMVILERVGFMLASGIFIFSQAFLLASDEQRKNKNSVIIILCISIIIPVSVYCIFRYVLYLMLPTGTIFYTLGV